VEGKVSNELEHSCKGQSHSTWRLPSVSIIDIMPELECSKDMGSYPFFILFTFHYLAFVSHDSLPYLSVVVM
jgi:hypothetical protein